MDRVTDEPDVVVEEYEEIIGDLDEFSDRTDTEHAEAESIQEPTSVDTRILTTHTGRPSLRSTNARLAGSQEESKPVVVTSAADDVQNYRVDTACGIGNDHDQRNLSKTIT